MSMKRNQNEEIFESEKISSFGVVEHLLIFIETNQLS